MDSAIVSALIAAGSTTVVAVAGFITTAKTTAKTLQSNRAMAQDQRLWEKKSSLYETILAETAHRQVTRADRLRQVRWDDETEKNLQEALAWEQPNYFAYEAKIRAYASDEVIEAFNVAFQADQHVWELVGQHQAAIEAAKSNPLGPEADRLTTYAPKIRERQAAADKATELLVLAVRRDLNDDHTSRGVAKRRDRMALPGGSSDRSPKAVE